MIAANLRNYLPSRLCIRLPSSAVWQYIGVNLELNVVANAKG
jgi:hypothetical protein